MRVVLFNAGGTPADANALISGSIRKYWMTRVSSCIAVNVSSETKSMVMHMQRGVDFI